MRFYASKIFVVMAFVLAQVYSTAAQGYNPGQNWRDDNSEIYGDLEVVQPIYDFGKTGSQINAAGSDNEHPHQALFV